MKRLLHKTLCALSCLLLLTSCYTTTYYTHPVEEDYNNTYLYCTAASIIDEFGKPTRVETTADGQEVLVYEKHLTPAKRRQVTTTDPAAQREYLEFYFDADSRCTTVKTNRVETVAERIKSKPTRKSIMWGIGGGAVLLVEGIVFILLI